MSASPPPSPPGRRRGRGRGAGDHVLGDALEAFLRTQGHGRAIVLARISSAWPDVVGPDVAAHAFPVRLREGILVVAVDHAGWATQLDFLAEQILDRLTDVVGPGLVERLEATLRRA